MAKEWIEQLAQNIRHKNRAAAEEFGRAQHRADIVIAQGRIFFSDVLRCLEEDFAQVRRLLQGDPASAEIAIVNTSATQVNLTRSRFPWFDAHVTHQDGTITLEYGKDPGFVNDSSLAERKTLVFDFHVSPEDKLSVQDAFGDIPATYAAPEDLARKITEILFKA